MSESLFLVAKGPNGLVWGARVGAERGGQGAASGLVVSRRVHTSSQSDSRRGAYRHTVLSVVDAATVGQHVDIGAFRTKLAVTLHTVTRSQSVQPIVLVYYPMTSAIGGSCGQRTFAKYLQTFSAAAPRSWLKGQVLPAWQAPCRKNLHGTWPVSEVEKELC